MPPLDFFSGSGSTSGSGGVSGTFSTSFSLPVHSVMFVLQTSQEVLTAPASHFVVQVQTGVCLSPSTKASRSASSTRFRK